MLHQDVYVSKSLTAPVHALRWNCLCFNCTWRESVCKSLCCTSTVYVCIQEPCLYTRALRWNCLRFSLVLHLELSVDKSLCYTCTCAFVLHLESAFLRGPVLHLYVVFCTAPGECLSTRACAASVRVLLCCLS